MTIRLITGKEPTTNNIAITYGKVSYFACILL
jgi:hypothetical protein